MSEENVTDNESTDVVDANANADATETQNEDTKSVDDLLSEFDKDTGGEDKSSGEAADDKSEQKTSAFDLNNDPDFQDVRDFVAQRRQAETDADISAAANVLKNSHEALAKVPDRVLRGVLQDKASDRRFVQAFTKRTADPAGWNKILTAIGRELGDEFTKAPDKNLSDDMESLRSSVGGTKTANSSSGPSDADILAMSDAEFMEHKQKTGLSDGSGW